MMLVSNVLYFSTGKKSRSDSVRSSTKPTKHPPPIPTRNDQPTDNSGRVPSANSKGPQLPFLSEQKNALKVTLSAPPSRTPPVAPPRESSDPTKRKGQISSSKSMELPKGKNAATDGTKANEGPNNDAIFQVKSFPFAVKDLQEIKSKSEELNKRRSVVLKMEQNTDTEQSLTGPDQSSPKDPPIPKNKPVAQPRKSSNENRNEIETETATKEVASRDANRITMDNDEKTENRQENFSHVTVTSGTERKHPVPPPRKPAKSFATDHDLRDVKPPQSENRPSVPPRKRRSGSYEFDVMNSQASNDDGAMPKVDVPTMRPGSNSVPGAHKPVPKPKPPLPPRQSSELISICESKAEQHNELDTAEFAGTNEIREVAKSGDSIESNGSIGVVLSETAENATRTIFTARPTKDLVKIKLLKEDVDLTEEPYTDVVSLHS